MCRVFGFTLIELIVVMLLLVVIAGMVVLNLGGDDAGEVREEAERLALLLNTVETWLSFPTTHQKGNTRTAHQRGRCAASS
jgi:prepilin-type N-terminal cleavage/methylation domain-containing protein